MSIIGLTMTNNLAYCCHSALTRRHLMPWPNHVSPSPRRRLRDVLFANRPTSVEAPRRAFLDWRIVSGCGSLAVAAAAGLFIDGISRHVEMMNWQIVAAVSLVAGVLSFVWLWKTNPARALIHALVMSSVLSVLHLTAGHWVVDLVSNYWNLTVSAPPDSNSTVVGLVSINMMLLVALLVERWRI